jgi:hypothetical protein
MCESLQRRTLSWKPSGSNSATVVNRVAPSYWPAARASSRIAQFGKRLTARPAGRDRIRSIGNNGYSGEIAGFVTGRNGAE